jgi:hypothetical protein
MRPIKTGLRSHRKWEWLSRSASVKNGQSPMLKGRRPSGAPRPPAKREIDLESLFVVEIFFTWSKEVAAFPFAS